MKYSKDYSDLTNDEKYERLMFEQSFKCSASITEEKRDYIINCLALTEPFRDNNLIDVSINERNNYLILNGTGGNNYPYTFFNGEIVDDTFSIEFVLDIEYNGKKKYVDEKFETIDGVIIHSRLGKDYKTYEEIERLNNSQLTFVNELKSKIKEKNI